MFDVNHRFPCSNILFSKKRGSRNAQDCAIYYLHMKLEDTYFGLVFTFVL